MKKTNAENIKTLKDLGKIIPEIMTHIKTKHYVRIHQKYDYGFCDKTGSTIFAVEKSCYGNDLWYWCVDYAGISGHSYNCPSKKAAFLEAIQFIIKTVSNISSED